MKVLSKKESQLLAQLLRLAGDSAILEIALLRARTEHGDDLTLDDVIGKILEVKAEVKVADAR